MTFVLRVNSWIVFCTPLSLAVLNAPIIDLGATACGDEEGPSRSRVRGASVQLRLPIADRLH
jgi:hypothetical protein